ncbi:sensor histidine kinase [Ottowia pentelensis]|uniref:sensor histidine kinase n=1 Tax=Ottowia pentelensis TaxID=511108 RepID=UPI00362EA056
MLLAVLPAVLATMAVSLVATRQSLDSVEAMIRANAQTTAYQIATAAEEPVRAEDRRALLNIARTGIAQSQVQQVRVWSVDGELLAEAHELGTEDVPGFLVTAPIPGAQGHPGGRVSLKASMKELVVARQKRWRDVLVSLVVALLAVLAAGAWAARRITAPVTRLGEALEKLGTGESTQVDVTGTPEIQRLLKGFNRSARALAGSHLEMQTRIREATAELARKNQQIERASQARMRLLAAASHDLRQPLHALTLLSEGLVSGETDPVRLQRIGHVRECVTSLDQLFSELLNLSQLDAGVLRPNWKRFALDQVFTNVSRDFRPVAEERGLRLVVRPTGLWVHSDFTMLSRILGNLVSNALRHTVTGGILVAARTRGSAVQIDVIDTGVGIPAELRERVFEEFYQADNLPQAAHRGESRGLGLGLATVRRLAHLLRTRIELKSVVGRGTCMRLRLKTCPPESPAQAAVVVNSEPVGRDSPD